MSIYAYCLVRLSSDEVLPTLRGIAARPVFPLRCDRYAMLLSRLERNFRFSARSIVEHGQVIRRVFETHTVLPVRFGTFFRSERQITELIRENRQDLLESFCRLRGKAEMHLKLLLDFPGNGSDLRKPPQCSRASNGFSSAGNGAHLDPQCQDVAEQISTRWRELFRPLDQQVTCRRLATGQLLVDCAHLIESQQLGSYQKACCLASEGVQDSELRMSGPWPPYHFLPATVRLPAPKVVPIRSRSRSAARMAAAAR